MSTTFKQLEQLYDGFHQPFMQVRLQDKLDTSKTVYITRAEIILSARYEASCCSMNLVCKEDCFKENGLQLDTDLSKYLILGNKIQIYAGYADNVKEIFSGYITTVTLSLQGMEIAHIVEAMDCKVLLMSNFKSEVKTGILKYSAAVAEVLQKYGSAASEQEITDTAKLTVPIEQYNMSDYDFIVDMAQRVHYLFYVSCGKVMFIPYSKAKTGSVVLSPGHQLFQLERSETLISQVQSVTVRNNDPADPSNPIEGTATSVETIGDGSKASTQVCSLIGSAVTRTVIDSAVRTQQQAEDRAKAELARLSLQFVTGEFQCVGVPELQAGEFIKISGFDQKTDGKYFLREVVHLLEVGKYQCNCKFESNKTH